MQVTQRWVTCFLHHLCFSRWYPDSACRPERWHKPVGRFRLMGKVQICNGVPSLRLGFTSFRVSPFIPCYTAKWGPSCNPYANATLPETYGEHVAIKFCERDIRWRRKCSSVKITKNTVKKWITVDILTPSFLNPALYKQVIITPTVTLYLALLLV